MSTYYAEQLKWKVDGWHVKNVEGLVEERFEIRSLISHFLAKIVRLLLRRGFPLKFIVLYWRLSLVQYNNFLCSLKVCFFFLRIQSPSNFVARNTAKLKLWAKCWLRRGVGGQFPRNIHWSKQSPTGRPDEYKGIILFKRELRRLSGQTDFWTTTEANHES